MKNRSESSRNFAQWFSFVTIRLMHDNRLLKKFVDPAEALRNLGLREGDRAFEPGCGPGFYTVGAAKAVGRSGEVVSFDVNPYACKFAREKVQKLSLGQVRVENHNAADSGLGDGTIDFAFVVGVPHVVGGEHNLMDELGRVVKPGGIMAYRSGRGNKAHLVEAAVKRGFRLETTSRRFLVFRK